MDDQPKLVPARVPAAREAAARCGFDEMSQDRTGALLRTLAASKPDGCLLELGTGTGVGTSWLLDGMNDGARLISLDRNPQTTALARQIVGDDPRLELVVGDIGEWLTAYDGPQFDLVFVDTWRGKYLERGQLLDLIAPGGLYIGDDLLPQPTWAPEQPGHVETFLGEIGRNDGLAVTVMNWASGLVVAAKQQRPASE
jgi:predicted O-methyltransferase YrrM